MKVPAHLSTLLTAWQLSLSTASPVRRTVTLDGYGEFTGTVINTTFSGRPLPAPVDAWLGMDYATQPTGENRFKPVDWPAPFDGVKAATTYGKTCIQDPTSAKLETQDEACLN